MGAKKLSEGNNIRYNWVGFAAVAAAMAYALYKAISLAWVCDDAFITFRYARNLINGHGLVFNIGERVEGYTSFLWTILIASGRLLEFDSVVFSQVLSIAAYLSTAIVLVLFSRRFSGRSSFILPVAALAILVMHDYHVWATSGMETSLAGFLVVTAAYLLATADDGRRLALAGLVMTAAVLTRPDLSVGYAMGGLFILLTSRSPWRAVLYFVAPAVVTYLPYWLVRHDYYGHPFPNTFYAKSCSSGYWSQGWTYLSLFIRSYYVLLLFIPAGIWLVVRLRTQIRHGRARLDMMSRAGLLAVMIVVPFVLCVVRIGGDFMFARFFIPIAALSFLVIEAALASLKLPLTLRAAAGLAIVLMSFASINQADSPEAWEAGIVNERAFYPPKMVEQAQIDGELLKRVFADIDSVTVAFYGTQAMLMYYSEFPMAIEAHAGLTDEYIAHLPINKRGRPGHEKNAPYQYLTQRRVLFIFPEQRGVPEERRIWFGQYKAAIAHWDNRVMERLKEFPEVRFTDFPVYLDQYMLQLGQRPDSLVQRDLRQFKQYYFDFNADTVRLNGILAHLEE